MADGKTDGQGSLLLATDFPVDNHWVSAHAVEGEYLTQLSTQKKYAPIAASVTVPIPDYVINAFRFDGAAFEWLVTGKSPRDLMVLVAEAWIYGDGTGGFTMSQVEWNVVMNGDATGWTVPDLPEPVKGWIDFANLPVEGGDATLSAVDMDSVTDLDSAWEMLVQGIDPEEAANEIFEGSQLIMLGNVALPAARQVAADSADVVRALDALQGLQRR